MLVCKHSDCINYENIDVAKGICLIDEQFVPFDAEACPRFSRKPKCKNCRNYKNDTEEGLGVCIGLDDGNHWISGEITAVTCEKFEETMNV
jgi:hypothetical protein